MLIPFLLGVAQKNRKISLDKNCHEDKEKKNQVETVSKVGDGLAMEMQN